MPAAADVTTSEPGPDSKPRAGSRGHLEDKARPPSSGSSDSSEKEGKTGNVL